MVAKHHTFRPTKETLKDLATMSKKDLILYLDINYTGPALLAWCGVDVRGQPRLDVPKSILKGPLTEKVVKFIRKEYGADRSRTPSPSRTSRSRSSLKLPQRESRTPSPSSRSPTFSSDDNARINHLADTMKALKMTEAQIAAAIARR
jgi:hypothetical protein